MDAGIKILRDINPEITEGEVTRMTDQFERLYKKAERLKRNEEFIHNECVVEGIQCGWSENFKQAIARYASEVAKYKEMLKKDEKKRKKEVIKK